MKFGKDEIQKMVLGGLMLVGLLYCYFVLLLGPLGTSRAQKQTQITEVRGKIAEAKKQIKKAQDVENAAPQHNLTIKHITALIPEGSPVAWFPVRVTEVFKQYGLDKTVTRMATEVPEKELTGYKRISWGIELPKAEAAKPRNIPVKGGSTSASDQTQPTEIEIEADQAPSEASGG